MPISNEDEIFGAMQGAPNGAYPIQFTVKAIWDAEASVWVAKSDDVPGLVTEAETLEALQAKLRVLIPELLEANGFLLPNGDESPGSAQAPRPPMPQPKS